MPAPIDWRRVARLALLSRRLDELETSRLTPQGLIKYQFSASGTSFANLAGPDAGSPQDAATVYYRSRPLLLACGLSTVEALAAGMARSDGLSDGARRGRGVQPAPARRPHHPASLRRRGRAVHPSGWLGRRLSPTASGSWVKPNGTTQ